jgi:hypothetical protein
MRPAAVLRDRGREPERVRAVSFGRRLGRLEVRGTRCPECCLTPSEHGRPVAVYPEEPNKGFQGGTSERCGRCGRFLYTVLRVVRDGAASEAAEGGGGRR